MTPARERLITAKDLILLCQKQGLSLGRGNPNNRLRYFTKIGLIPHAQRKQVGVNAFTEGHYPFYTLQLLEKIQELKKAGKTMTEIDKIMTAEKLKYEIQTTGQTLGQDLSLKTPPPTFNFRLWNFGFRVQRKFVYVLAGIILLTGAIVGLTATPYGKDYLQRLTDYFSRQLADLIRPALYFPEVAGVKIPEETTLDLRPQVLSENLLANPSFENPLNTVGTDGQGKTKFGQAWRWGYLEMAHKGNFYVSNDSVRSGTLAMKVWDSGTEGAECKMQNAKCKMNLGISQTETNTVNGRHYSFSVFLRSKDLLGHPKLRLGFMGQASKDDPNYTRLAKDEVVASAPVEIAGVSGWTPFTFTYENAALGKYPFLEIIDYQGGVIYLDDASLMEFFFESSAAEESQLGSELAAGSSSAFKGSGGGVLVAAGFPGANLFSGAGSVKGDNSANFYPADDSMGSLGLTSKRFATLFVNDANLKNTLKVGGQAEFLGAATISGNLKIDNAKLILSASQLGSDLNPAENIKYNLGDGTTPLRWLKIWSKDADFSNAVSIGGSLTVQGTTLATTGNIETSGNLTVGGNSILGNSTADTLTVSGTTTINLPDNTINAFDLQEGTNDYINIDTTNSSEKITLGSTSINPTLVINAPTINSVSTTALNLGAATLDFNGAGIIQYGDGSNFTLRDDGVNNIFKLTGSTNLLEFGNAIDNNAFTFLGSGIFTIGSRLTVAQTGLLTLVNNATIDNTTAGIITLTEPTIRLSGSTAVKIDSPTLDLSTQATNVDLKNTTLNALSFETSLLSLDTQNSRVGIGTTTPGSKLGVLSNVSIGATYGNMAAPTSGLIVEGNVGIGTTNPGAYALQVKGATYLNGSVILGATTSDSLTVNGYVISNLIPDPGSTYNLGSNTRRWLNLWADTVTATNLSGTVITGMTSSYDWLIGSANATADTQDITLTFERGVPATNAEIRWNSTSKWLSTNAPTFFINPDSGITASGKAALIVNQIQNQDLFTASASGTPKFVITNSGSVGIGTTSPAYKLEVNGTLGVGSTASFTSLVNVATLTASSGVYTDASKNLTSTIPATGSLGYWQRNSTYVSPATITDSVGIGTTSPSRTLDVNGNLGVSSTQLDAQHDVYTIMGSSATTHGQSFTTIVSGNLAYFDIKSTNTPSNSFTVRLGEDMGGTVLASSTSVTSLGSYWYRINLDLNPSLTAGQMYTIVYSGGSLTVYITTDSSYSGGRYNPAGFGWSNTDDMSFRTYINFYFIVNNGNVGIGTTSPSAPLSVGATSQFQVSLAGAVTAVGVNSGSGLIQGTGGLTVTGTTNLNATGTSATTIGNATGALSLASNAFNLTTTGAVSGITTLSMNNQLTNSYANAAALNLTGNGAGMTFTGTGPNQIITAASQNLALMPGGNVGIGTTSPSNKLDVVGNINTSGVYKIGGNQILSYSSSPDQLILGVGANGNPSTGTNITFLGNSAGNRMQAGDYNTFVGYGSGYGKAAGTNNGADNTALGYNSLQNIDTGGENVALGYQAGRSIETGQYNIFLGSDAGNGAATSLTSSIAIGYAAVPTVNNQLVVGSNSVNGKITDSYWGNGVTVANPADFTFNASGGSGTDNAGASLILAGGKGTGSAAGGALIFKTSDALGSGTTLQSLTEKMRITATGSVGIGTTSPAYKLEVNGTLGVGSTASFSSLVNLAVLTASSGVYTDASKNLTSTIPTSGTLGYWQRNGTNLAPATIGDSVGIGTTSPYARLTSNVGAASTTSVAGYIYGSTSTGTFVDSNGSTRSRATLTVGGAMATDGWDLLNVYSGSVDGLLFVASEGNVGIGTTNPGGSLEVAQTVTAASAGTYYQTKLDNTYSGTMNSATPVTSIYGMYNRPNIGIGGTSPQLTNLFVNYVSGNIGVGTTSSVTNLYGLYVDNPTTNTGSTVTNNYGLYVNTQSAGTNNFALYSAGGTNYFGGNVGIGTTSPRGKLDVAWPGTGLGNIYFGDWTNGWALGENVDASLQIYKTASGTTLTSLMTILNSGNVGIGTTNPGASLHIYKSGAFAETQIESSSSYASLLLKGGAAGDVSWAAISGYPNAGDFDIREVGVADRLVIKKTSGNVGIGTMGPDSKLTVTGGDAAYSASIYNTRGDATGHGLFVQTRWNVADNFIARFLTNSGSTDVLAIKGNGNVGIGTTGPAGRLHVKIDTIGDGFRVEGSGTLSPQFSLYDSTTQKGAFGLALDNNHYSSFSTPGDIVMRALGSSGDIIITNQNGGNIYLASGTGSGNDTPKFTMTSNGNIGIGTTAPATPLTIGPIAATQMYLRINAPTNYGAGLELYTGATVAKVYSAGNAQDIRINVNNVDVFTAVQSGATADTLVLKAGNVGIGTTGPGFRLDVQDDDTPGQMARFLNTASYGRIIIEGADGTGGDMMFKENGVSQWGIYSSGQSAAATLGFYPADGSTPAMLIQQGGNVGIGTTAPTSPLHIYSASTPQIHITAPSSGLANMRLSSVGNRAWELSVGTSGLSFNDIDGSVTPLYIKEGGNVGIGTTAPSFRLSLGGTIGNKFAVFENPGGTNFYGLSMEYTNPAYRMGLYVDGTERMSLDTNNNVGIGTTVPGQKLDVNGTIRQTGCKTAGTLSANTSGDIICTSDENLKNIYGYYQGGLNALSALNPIRFSYKGEDFIHVGFSAQNVKSVLPEASALQDSGYWSLDTTSVVALAVNAIKEQQGQIATQSAGLASLQASFDTNGNLVSSISAQIKNLDLSAINDQVVKLENSFLSLDDKYASITAELKNQISLLTLGLGPQASASAGLTNLNGKDATLSGQLTVLGRTLLSDLGLTGKITNGLLVVNGLEGSIETLALPLKLQATALGNIEMMGQKIVIDQKGNVKVEGTLTAKKVETEEFKVLGAKTAGSASLLAGQLVATISAEAATASARILLTPTTLTDKVLTVTEKRNGEFAVGVSATSSADIKFDWFIVGN